MKYLSVFALILMCLWVTLFFMSNNEKEELSFLDYLHTNILKGYAIIFILFGHVGQYLGINGIEYPTGVGVSLFLILSGYGIAVSCARNGFNSYWKKRVQRVWIPYIISNGLYLLAEYIKGATLTFKDVLLNFTLIKPLYVFGWYLRYIMVCYIIFFVIWKYGKKVMNPWIMLCTSFAVWFIIRSSLIVYSTPFLQARQMLAFPLGILLATLLKTQSDSLVLKNKVISVGCIVIGTGIYGFLHIGLVETKELILYNFISLFTCVLCAIGFILLVFQWKILQNRGLRYISLVSYELYLIHGYVIQYVTNNSLRGIIIFIISSFFLAFILHLIMKVPVFMKRKKNV